MAGLRSINPKALIGKSLQQGRYVLTHVLGQGSFGIVFKAEERLAGERLRDVAVKWMPDVDPAQIRREAQAVAAMPPHPNIVTFFTALPLVAPAKGMILVLELVEGQSLGSRIKEGVPEPTERVVSWLFQILKGLDHAHAHRIVHRDLKPDNILMSRDGTLKITDFGIARRSEPSSQSSPNVVQGTPAYMAPEQFGRVHDHRVDLYALGVMTFEMLTGHRPFQGSPLEVMKGHISETPAIPSSIDPPLREFLDRAMAKDPDQRFDSAAAMREALLDNATPDEGSQSRSVSTLAGRMAGPPRKGGDRDTMASAAREGRETPPAVEIHAQLPQPESEAWEQGARDPSILEAVKAAMLPGATNLARSLLSPLELVSASRQQLLRLTRKVEFETRRVEEKFETYENQRLPRLIYDSPTDVDPWSPAFEVPRVSEEQRLTAFRLPGSERRARCMTCRNRGRLPCQDCGDEIDPVCRACGGKGEFTCQQCDGMGEVLGYLSVEARFETSESVSIASRGQAEFDAAPAGLEASAGTRLLAMRSSWLEADDVSAEFPMPGVRLEMAGLLGASAIDGSCRPLRDEAVLESFTLGKLDLKWPGGSGPAWVDEATGYCGAGSSLRDWAEARLRDQLFQESGWSERPAEVLGWAVELLSSPAGEAYFDELQGRTLNLGQRLLDQGQTGQFRELRKPISRLVALDSGGQWRQRWADVMVQQRNRRMEAFRAALQPGASKDDLPDKVRQLADLDVLIHEGEALCKEAIEAAQSLVKSGDLQASDSLIQALSSVEWPIKGSREALTGLSSETLEKRSATLTEQANQGAPVESLFQEISFLVEVCPRLPSLDRSLRAFRKRLHQEFRQGSLVAGCEWSRRTQDDLTRTRPDLAGLFAHPLSGSEDCYIEAVEQALSQGDTESALDLLLLSEADLTGDPRALQLARSLDLEIRKHLETDWLDAVRGGRLAADVEQPLTRALGAMMRLQNWCPRGDSPSSFAPALWALIQELLATSTPRLAEPLIALALEMRVIGEHPVVGPAIRFVHPGALKSAAEKVTRELVQDGNFEEFLTFLRTLSEQIPHDDRFPGLIDSARGHLSRLADTGSMEELARRCEKLREVLTRTGSGFPGWLSDPAESFRPGLERFVAENGASGTGAERSLSLIRFLNQRKVNWVPELQSLLDRSLIGAAASPELSLSTLPPSLVAKATEPDSAFARAYRNARTALEGRIRLVGTLVILPLAIAVLPLLLPSAGVPRPYGWKMNAEALAAAGAILLATWCARQVLPALALACSSRLLGRRDGWLAGSIITGLLASPLVFGAAALAVKALGGS